MMPPLVCKALSPGSSVGFLATKWSTCLTGDSCKYYFVLYCLKIISLHTRKYVVGPCAHGVTAIFAGCVLPQFPVIIIIWKLHRISNILIQHEFISAHQNTNVYDPGNGLHPGPPSWTCHLMSESSQPPPSASSSPSSLSKELSSSTSSSQALTSWLLLRYVQYHNKVNLSLDGSSYHLNTGSSY